MDRASYHLSFRNRRRNDRLCLPKYTCLGALSCYFKGLSVICFKESPMLRNARLELNARLVEFYCTYTQVIAWVLFTF
jgi:hypothetical protein